MTAVIHPTLEEFRARTLEANIVPVHAEILADTITPISAYLSLVGDRAGFLLESAEGGEKLGRYSFIGLDPWEIVATAGRDPLREIEERLAACRAFRDPLLPRFAGGAVGYIGYDCIRYFEPTLGRVLDARARPGLDLPEAAFMIGGKLAIFDHVKRRVILVVNARLDGKTPDDAYAAARREIEAMANALRNMPRIPERAGAAGAATAPIAANCRRDEFLAAVARAREYIAAGDIFQVVLSQRFERAVSAPPFDIYRALRAVNPSPYMYYLNYPDAGRKGFTVVGSSPEVMVRIEDRRITLRPIAGTRPRGRDESEDRALETELLADHKECAEHIMLVDLGRNDVGRVAIPGSVRVDELMTIERYSHVMHIVSNVSGALDASHSVYDVIRAAFPAGTVSGAPKIRAMEIIAELEPSGRGPYAGAVGYVGFDGNADTAIVLRTILVADGRAYVQAGAGIVHDSIPEREFEETENKARAMMRALSWAEAGL